MNLKLNFWVGKTLFVCFRQMILTEPASGGSWKDGPTQPGPPHRIKYSMTRQAGVIARSGDNTRGAGVITGPALSPGGSGVIPPLCYHQATWCYREGQR